jgi:hypothetical protein
VHAATPAPTSGTLEIWWKAPGSGATVSGTIQDTGCYVNGRGVSRVEFYLGSTLVNSDTRMSDGMSCLLDTTKFANGSHTLTAVAYDSSGRTYREPRSIRIQNAVPTGNQVPSVSFAMPTDGATISGKNYECTASASDADGSIAMVEIYLDGALQSRRNAPPYMCGIDTTRFANGTHTLTAVATDNAGARTTTSVSVSVNNGATSTPSAPTGNQAPSVSFAVPTNGATISGKNYECTASASDADGSVAMVEIYLAGALQSRRTAPPYMCGIDTTRFANGTHTLTAVATDNTGARTTTQVSVNVNNGATTSPTAPTGNQAPSVSFAAPTSGATISGKNYECTVNASDADGSIAMVEIYLDDALQSRRTAPPFKCGIDTTRFSNGTHTLMALATDNAGAKATAQSTVTVDNTATSNTGGSTGSGTIDAADIVQLASADSSFSSQSGFNAQVIGQHLSIGSVAESGVHYNTLPNGETMRFGKVVDPQNSAAKALLMQVHKNDPNTSSAKRTELRMGNNIEWDKTYWAAVSVYVYDWGTLSTSDQALYGIQLHSGDDSAGYSPSFALYTVGNGRRFNVQARGPAGTKRYAEQDIPFGRWVDYVFKFRQSAGSSGLLQVWQDGQQIVDHRGELGYKVSQKDYFKFGYYNWTGASSSSTARKVLLRNPTIVADPTGSKYSASQLRALVSSGSSGTLSASGGGSASSGDSTTSSGVCSTAICVATQ